MSIIQLRRDTTANWLSVNPVLAQGELGIAYNGDVVATIRIGNGAATWTQLPDFGGNGDLTQAAADLLYATLAQGELADTAVQPGDLPTFGDVVTHNASEFATAAQGTDARTPTAHAASHATAGTDPLTLAQSQVTGLTSDLAAKVGTSDPRLTDPRTPTSHAASHAAAGADPLTVAQSQVTNLGTDLAAKVPTSRTIAGLGLDADRSSADLKTALTLVKGDVGLGNVDNTADADKPVSTPQAAAIGNAVSTASLDATSKANTAQANAISAAAADATSKADAKVADAINDGTTTVAPSQNAVFDALAAKIANPGGSNDDFLQRKAGVYTNRTIAQVKTDLGVVTPVWTLIEERILGANSALETFSSLTGYTQFLLAVEGRSTGTGVALDGLLVRLNADTGGNYAFSRQGWYDTTADTSTGWSGQSSISAGFLAGSQTNTNRRGMVTAQIMQKTGGFAVLKSEYVCQLSNSGTAYGGRAHGSWASATSISSLSVFLASGSLASGAVIRLEGRA